MANSSRVCLQNITSIRAGEIMSEEILEVWIVDQVYESWNGYYAHLLPIVPRNKAKPFNVVSYPLTTQSGRVDRRSFSNVVYSLSLLNLDYRDFIDPFWHCVYTVPRKIGEDVLISKEYITDTEAIDYLLLAKEIRFLKGIDWSKIDP